MSDMADPNLSGVAETSLIPLYVRAMETQRPHALIKDEKAVELLKCISYDFDRIRQVPGSEAYSTVRVLIGRELDHYAQDFLKRHPD